ncbi:HAD family hydrolase [Clostridium sp.]|uniref:HAD family hydrolase n=2 Tax=unclassified Clostridium TaxID=2614128 RepID=UPI001B5241F6|nr:HAD family hydrolase [Clostridium sp.]MBP3916444.1 HAD family hydrolase [Clostridium sp.]MEE0932371.1 HAD family hydrolase [Clostridium sp.]
MKYIIFDYDGTLHNSIKIYKPAFMKAYDYLVANGYAKKREFEEEEISKFLGLSPKDMWNTFMPNLPKCEKEKCSSIIGQAMIEYIDKGEVQLYDCTIETLNKLNEYGYKLIFLSNCKSSYMNKHIEKFNLNKYFIDFYCSEDFHFIPKYEIFKFIKENYQGDFIVVGDRFVDIELAKKHNLFSIGCSYGYGNYDELKEADYIIENIKDIIHILGI